MAGKAFFPSPIYGYEDKTVSTAERLSLLKQQTSTESSRQPVLNALHTLLLITFADTVSDPCLSALGRTKPWQPFSVMLHPIQC